MLKRRAKKINHLLVIRLTSMGDVAMIAPVVGKLREAHPDIRITILTKPLFEPFFRDIDNIEFMELDSRGVHRGLVGSFRLAHDIRKAGADAVVDLQDESRISVVKAMLLLSGIRVTSSRNDHDGLSALTRRTRKEFKELLPVVERYRQSIKKLGLYFPMQDYYKRAEGSSKKVACALPESFADGPKEGVWVGVAPFAKHKGKIYPIPLTDKLIEMLHAKYDKVFILGGGRYEKDFAEGMEQRHPGVASIIGKYSLSDEMDFISNLDAIVTMDSATMHIASIVGVPVISVWGATHPFAGFYGWGQAPEDAVQLQLPCRPCSVYADKSCIFGDYRCLSDIAPEAIVAVVDARICREHNLPVSKQADQQSEDIPEFDFSDIR